MSTESNNQSQLTLGWKVSPTQEPAYWLNKDDAKAGRQSDNDLVQVAANAIGCHTAIIAQSGSGKSFFLGRIIEEIMLNTKARCLILDPNADFRKVYDIEGVDLWTKAKYDPLTRTGRLPHESSKEDFEHQWKQIPIMVKTGATGPKENYEQLKIRWPSISVAFLAEDLDPILRSDLYHCHAFVQALEPLVKLKAAATKKSIDLIDVAENLMTQGRALSTEHFRLTIESEFNAQELLKSNEAEKKEADQKQKATIGNLTSIVSFLTTSFSQWFEASKMLIVKRSIERVLLAPKYVSEDVKRFYFGKAREYQAAGILHTSVPEPTSTKKQIRLEVIDLPFLRDTSTRLLAINSLVANEWERMRAAWSDALQHPSDEDQRVPTFVVIDEAHNLIPAEPHNKAEIALREQFRTLVAEGRKYGLFLLLVSQRPDKLDALVLSECENKAVMRLGSASVLNLTKQMLGLDDISPGLLNKCLEFEIGRALLIGRWAPDGPKIIYAAARRTVEGGRNLRAKFWGSPASLPSADKPTKIAAIDKQKTTSKKGPNSKRKRKSKKH